MKQKNLVMGGSRFVSYQIAKYFSDLHEEVLKKSIS